MASGLILKQLIEKLDTNISQFERNIKVGASTVSKAIQRNSGIRNESYGSMKPRRGDWLLRNYSPNLTFPTPDYLELLENWLLENASAKINNSHQ